MSKETDKLNVKAIAEAGEIEHFSRDFFVKKGKKGGGTTLKRYGKKKMTEWGKMGGRPRKSFPQIDLQEPKG